MSFWSRFLFLSVVVLAALQPVPGRAQHNRADLEQIQKLNRVYSLLGNSYIDDVDMAPIVEEAIKASLAELDPHSTYLNKEAMQAEMEVFEGEFSGIGVEYNILQDTIIVVNTIVGGPAEKSGVRPNDRIVEIDGRSAVGIGREQAPKLLRGERGSVVEVGVQRRGKPDVMHFSIVRDKIPITTIDAVYKPIDRVGYIKVNRFGHTTMSEFREAMAKLGRIDGLILDLRGNGGGLLGQAVDMAGYFLPKGALVTYTEGRAMAPEYFHSGRYGEFDGQLIVLIDENSASASEIVAGAVQDWDRGVIVGRESFGKGLVQRQISLGDGSALRLTVARYHTPSGRVIQRPYAKGDKESYYKAHYDRLLGRADTLAVDSLPIFETLKSHRKVYGGGGIRPDVIVSDTLAISDYAVKLYSQGVMRDFVVAYLDRHRECLTALYPTFEQFDADFALQDADFGELAAMASARGVEYDEAGLQQSREFIGNRLSAMIAQGVFSTTEFYRWLNPREDDAYRRALEMFADWRESALPLLKAEQR